VADPLDVDARLAEGRPAVGNVGDYVWACHLLGYQNADLTLHAAQVRDWYDSEDGLDLRALDADRAALEAVAMAADDARQLQEGQIDVLADAWEGRGGDASRDFLLRHEQASAAAASAVRDAVDALATLREDLWRAVDEKVAAAVAIENRRQSERAQWRAAAQTVTTGAGDRAVASEMVDQQVKPFVHNDIQTDWLTAMQGAMAAVTAAFDAATGALTGGHSAGFQLPGDLGPSAIPSWSGSTPPAGTAPAGWPSSASPAAPAASSIAAPPPAFAAPEPPPAASMPAAPIAAPPAAGPTSAAPSMPSTPSLGELGGGLPGGAGGLAGLGSQFADAIGGLLNRPDDMLADPPEPDDEEVDDDEPGDDELDDDELDDDADDETDAEPGEVDEPVEPAADAVEGCADQADVDEEPPAEPVATTPPAPVPPQPQPIVDPPPSAEPLGAETPCEIAADELPQAGP
jgi:hypothetical protein